MSKSRNERRKAAKERLLRKTERLAKAELGRQSDERRLIVKKNLTSRIERNYYPQCTMGGFASQSHRGYVCKAGGAGKAR